VNNCGDNAAADADDDTGVRLLRTNVGKGQLGVVVVAERWRGRRQVLPMLLFSFSALTDGGTATGI